MRVLILGGDGMLGHRLFLGLKPCHQVAVTLRGERSAYHRFGLFAGPDTLDRIDARDDAGLAAAVATVQPAVVINAIGIVKQHPSADDIGQCEAINARLPHRLAALCRTAGARLVHISTDCVFAGTRGNYREDDPADALDLYGRTKRQGEVAGPGCLTLRTSIIGLELHRNHGLIEWYLRRRGPVPGFTGAIFSGLTTTELTRVIGRLLDRPDLDGLFHVASQPISKCTLLQRLTVRLGREARVTVVPTDGVRCDRSLCGDRFAAATGYTAPSWDDMLDELADEIKARESMMQ